MMAALAFVLAVASTRTPYPIVGILPSMQLRAQWPSAVPIPYGEWGPMVSAVSAVALDATSGTLLWGKQPYTRRPLASTTKLLTAIAVLRAQMPFDAMATVRSEDLPPEGHTILHVDDRVRVGDLLTAMLVYSDNGAARVLGRTQLAASPADVVPGAMALRAVARSLGARTVQIMDPAGLDPRNLGSAMDVALLLRAALAQVELRDRLTLAEAIIPVQRGDRTVMVPVRSTNALLHTGGARTFQLRGAKTGYIDESGYNLALAVSRDREGVVVLVLLGSPSSDDRFRDARVLADWILSASATNDARVPVGQY
ncbi:D-alanyl-D-alanine carboxypeptidase [Candidatus Uhrbacteria bacterium]|nr:D-alanyl-D-alanine carboxypeptidase [Candidatus Uhrbacteria bacterium]